MKLWVLGWCWVLVVSSGCSGRWQDNSNVEFCLTAIYTRELMFQPSQVHLLSYCLWAKGHSGLTVRFWEDAHIQKNSLKYQFRKQVSRDNPCTSFSGFFCQAQDLILADTERRACKCPLLSAEGSLLFIEQKFPVIWTKFLSNQAGFPSGKKKPHCPTQPLDLHWCPQVVYCKNKAHTKIPHEKAPLARSCIDGPLICLLCFWDVAFFDILAACYAMM